MAEPFYRDHAFAMDADLTEANAREAVRAFFVTSIQEGDYRNHYRAYRYEQYPIETELMARLDAFSDRYELRSFHLKLIRRFLLQRYAFLSARKIDKKLSDVGVLWLCKDYFIPRIGLSLVIGFGGIMGSSAIFDFLAVLRCTAATLFSLGCLLVVLFLVYLNVRDVITGSHPNVWGRTLWVFAVALAWVGLLSRNSSPPR